MTKMEAIPKRLRRLERRLNGGRKRGNAALADASGKCTSAV
jgi:hypothetical protein